MPRQLLGRARLLRRARSCDGARAARGIGGSDPGDEPVRGRSRQRRSALAGAHRRPSRSRGLGEARVHRRARRGGPVRTAGDAPPRIALAVQRPFPPAAARGGSRRLAADGDRRRRAVHGGLSTARIRRAHSAGTSAATRCADRWPGRRAAPAASGGAPPTVGGALRLVVHVGAPRTGARDRRRGSARAAHAGGAAAPLARAPVAADRMRRGGRVGPRSRCAP